MVRSPEIAFSVPEHRTAAIRGCRCRLMKSSRRPWADMVQGIDDLLALKTLEPLTEKLEGDEKVQLERWLARQEVSILHAMEQTRQISVEVEPYWQD